MVTDLKSKLTQENISIFLFVAMFWVYVARLGLFNGTAIVASLFGIYCLMMHRLEVWTYFKQSKFIYFFLLMFIPIVFSVFNSTSPEDSYRVVMNILRFVFIGVLAILLTDKSLEKIRKWVLVFVVIISVDAICEWLLGYHLLGKVRDTNRIQGLFKRYPLGYFMGTIAPIIIYQMYISFVTKNKWKYLWLVLALCTIFTVFIAGSRAGWVSLIVGLMILFLWLVIQRKISFKKSFLVMLVALVVGVGISQVPIVKARFFNPNGAAALEVGSYEWVDRLSSSRLVLWSFAWKQYVDHPILGSGAGSFEKNFSKQPKELKGVYDEANFVHFHGLEVLSETGAIGFLSYLIMLSWLFMLIIKSPQFPVWLVIAFVAMMPINMHIALYSSFWAMICWVSLILGLRERYLLMQKDPVNA